MKILSKSLLILFAVTSFTTVQCQYYLAVVSKDKKIKIWNPQNWNKKPKTLNPYFWPPLSTFAFSPDGKYLVTGSNDNTIRIWNPQNWKEKPKIPVKGFGYSLSIAFSPDSKYLAVKYSRTIKIWNTQNWKEKPKTLDYEYVTLDSTVFSPKDKKGNYYIVLASENRISMLDPQTVKGRLKTSHHEDKGFRSIAFSPNGKYLATYEDSSWLSINSEINICDLKTRELHKKILFRHGYQNETFCIYEPSIKVESIAFSPDSKYLVSGLNNGVITIWNTTTRKLQTLESHKENVNLIAFSPDSKYLASGSSDAGTIKIWDTKTWSLLKTLYHEYCLNSLVFSPIIKRLTAEEIQRKEKDLDTRIKFIAEM